MTDILTGNEQIQVLGQTAKGGPSPETFPTTTGEIAGLAGSNQYFYVIQGNPDTLVLQPNVVGWNMQISVTVGGQILLDGEVRLTDGAGQIYSTTSAGLDIEVVDGTTGGIYLQGSNGITTEAAGGIFLQGGDGGSTSGNGSDCGFQSGNAHVSGASGGTTSIIGGSGLVPGAAGGGVDCVSGNGQGTGVSGSANLHSGSTQNAKSGQVAVFSGPSTLSSTGDARLTTGDAGGGNSGNVVIGCGNATGTKGNILMVGLPTADPHVVGALWQDPAAAHALKVSVG